MPNEEQEQQVASAFLTHYNKSHRTRFRITGRPKRDTAGNLTLDFRAVCERTGDKMLIEVGQAEIGNPQGQIALMDNWQVDFEATAAGRSLGGTVAS
jgi:hypothetical protein